MTRRNKTTMNKNQDDRYIKFKTMGMVFPMLLIALLCLPFIIILWAILRKDYIKTKGY